jgi:hypothetical protein
VPFGAPARVATVVVPARGSVLGRMHENADSGARCLAAVPSRLVSFCVASEKPRVLLETRGSVPRSGEL